MRHPKTHNLVPIKKITKVYGHCSRDGNAENTYVNGVPISGIMNTALKNEIHYI